MKISIDNILNEINAFYHSNFWKQRYLRRLDEELINVSQLESALKATDNVCNNIILKTYSDNTSSNGLSYKNIIKLNENIDAWEKDPEHFTNLIMHELGHIQYNQPGFRQAQNLNKLIINNPLPIGLENEKDIEYFSDHNEIRQRIIPLVKDMYLNDWSPKETYRKSCKYDDIFDLYSEGRIIHWIDNIL